ncbi:MAG: Gfo/Idh/MocA family oxidoreductase [Chloroflexi bacterium]|nr:Gfo/Idh/MocA family oxidoreductase [Chloroflexota bacterium]MCL5109040.1 Gfo/Idh/MocA family oxidoreductase [Chloroflexota bacterium]
MRIGIVGCGSIGQKRARALASAQLVACADAQPERATALARAFPSAESTDWPALVERPDVDVVVVSTTHDVLAEITLAAVRAGKHVLVEKPAARCAAELVPVIEAAELAGVLVRVGFNHRYHPALRKARELCAAGELGELMFLRGRYGHGGRPGYEKEWRAIPELSGGGELIDQGVHLVDLARCFLGDFAEVQGFAHTYYWDMPVEDNGFLLLKTEHQQVAFLHASCTEWKNLFSFEVYGRQGKVEVTGLGGSYGTERIAFYRMLPQMGPPETTIWEYPMADTSWEGEFAEFLEDIRLVRQPAASLLDAHAVLRIIERVYEVSKR